MKISLIADFFGSMGGSPEPFAAPLVESGRISPGARTPMNSTMLRPVPSRLQTASDLAHHVWQPIVVVALLAAFSGYAAPAGSAETNVQHVEPKIYQIEELDRAPVAKQQDDPVFPSALPPDKLDAEVTAAFVIDPNGHVIAPRARECTVYTVSSAIDFDSEGRGMDAETHASAAPDAHYAALQKAAAMISAAAVQTVSKWTFKPGRKNGQPVYTVMAVKLDYSNRGSGLSGTYIGHEATIRKVRPGTPNPQLLDIP